MRHDPRARFALATAASRARVAGFIVPDLPFDEDHIADAGKMVAAIDELLQRKPHLATRRPAGDIGQGNRGASSGNFSLLDMLKERT